MTSPPPTYSDAIKDNDELFVTLSDCQYHASLLHTFYNLRIKDPALEKVYLARAERRYYLWMDHVQEFEPSTQILPPIGNSIILTHIQSTWNILTYCAVTDVIYMVSDNIHWFLCKYHNETPVFNQQSYSGTHTSYPLIVIMRYLYPIIQVYKLDSSFTLTYNRICWEMAGRSFLTRIMDSRWNVWWVWRSEIIILDCKLTMNSGLGQENFCRRSRSRFWAILEQVLLGSTVSVNRSQSWSRSISDCLS
jgi:hypothetical protein